VPVVFAPVVHPPARLVRGRYETATADDPRVSHEAFDVAFESDLGCVLDTDFAFAPFACWSPPPVWCWLLIINGEAFVFRVPVSPVRVPHGVDHPTRNPAVLHRETLLRLGR